MGKVYLCYGLNQIVKVVVTNEMAREIWDKSSGLHSDPNFLWINREATEDDIEKYSHPEITIK
jgi:hypothetical protein